MTVATARPMAPERLADWPRRTAMAVAADVSNSGGVGRRLGGIHGSDGGGWKFAGHWGWRRTGCREVGAVQAGAAQVGTGQESAAQVGARAGRQLTASGPRSAAPKSAAPAACSRGADLRPSSRCAQDQPPPSGDRAKLVWRRLASDSRARCRKARRRSTRERNSCGSSRDRGRRPSTHMAVWTSGRRCSSHGSLSIDGLRGVLGAVGGANQPGRMAANKGAKDRGNRPRSAGESLAMRSRV